MLNLPQTAEIYEPACLFIEKVSSKVYVKRFDFIEPKGNHLSSVKTVMLRVSAGR